MLVNKNNRYPGAMPFQDNDHDRLIFKGREKDAKNLLHLILSETLVVIYGKSGMGKTSLINAGVLNPLREKDYFPVTVRLNQADISPVEAVISTVEQKAANNGIIFQETDKASLWAYFYFNGFMKSDNLLIPIIILDQFEEFFFLHNEDVQNEFITQLSQLVRGIVPSKYKSMVNSANSQVPEVKVVISLREDYLGYLEKMTPSIPTILRNRFRVFPLTREQARQAIEEPARLTGDKMSTKPFSFDQIVVEEIIDILCAHNKKSGNHTLSEVEAFPLQWICQHLEDSVRERQNNGEKHVIITMEFIGRKEKIYQIFSDYYGNMLLNLKLATRKHKAVVKLFEKGLISASWKRLSLEEEYIEDRFNVSREILHQLADLRMLHIELRADGTYYELSHDTLVTAIQETKAKRNSQEQYKGIKKIFGIGIFLIIAYFIVSIKGLNKLGLLNIPFAVLLLLSIVLMIITVIYDRNFIVGMLLYKIKNYKMAIPQFLKAIDNYSYNKAIYGFLGATYYRISRYNRAVSILNIAIELEPGDVSNYYFLGSSYRKLKKITASKDTFSRLILLNLSKIINTGINCDADIGSLSNQQLLQYAESVVFKHPQNREGSLGIAEYYFLNNEYTKTLELCIKYLESFPKDSIALCLAAEAHTHMDNIDEAIYLYKAAIRYNSKMIAPYIELSVIYIKLCEYVQALKILKKAVKINPHHAEISLYLNVVQYKYGKYEKYFKQVRKQISYNLKILGIAISEKNSTYQVNDKLVQTIRTEIELNPKDVDAHVDLGDYYMRMEEYDQAKEIYNTVITLDVQNLRAYEMLGFILLNEEKFEEAIEMYNKAIELCSKDPNTYLALGWLFSHMDKLDEARVQYMKTLELSPESGDAYCYLGYLLCREEKLEEAKLHFLKAIELGTQNKDVFVSLGWLYLMEDNYSEAKALFEKAIEVGVDSPDPNGSSPYNAMGILFYMQNELEESRLWFEKAIELDPGEIENYTYLIYICNTLGEKEKVIEYTKKAYELDPENILALGSQAWDYYEHKDYDKAIKLNRKALSIDGRALWIEANLGLVLLHNNQFEEAKNEYIAIINNLASDQYDIENYGNDKLAILNENVLKDLHDAQKVAQGHLFSQINEIIDLLENFADKIKQGVQV